MSLKLSRKAGQTIQIGPDVFIKVESIEGNRVRLSIDAPRVTPIVRSELIPNSPPAPLPVEDAARHIA